MSYAVITRVRVSPGSIDELAALFDETNRALVAQHADWLRAWFTANRSENEITVIAHWRDANSYERLRDSDAFESTMARFAAQFAAPPIVTINEILVEM